MIYKRIGTTLERYIVVILLIYSQKKLLKYIYKYYYIIIITSFEFIGKIFLYNDLFNIYT